MTPVATHVALLRGVNVGGRNRVPMAALREALATAGLGEARTHLQSGNVVVGSGASPDETGRRIAGAIADAFALEITVLVRTPDELAGLASRNPYLDAEADGSKVHVVFLENVPDGTVVAGLDPNRSPPDAFVVSGRELFVHYPNGAGRSKLTLDYLERTLGVRGTARNWNTVRALLDLAAQR